MRPNEDSVQSRAGNLRIHRWEPASPAPLTVVTVHPWATLGGSEANCVGIAETLARAGLRAVTFNMRSSSMVWGVLSNHSSEVRQVVDVCEWANATFGAPVLLFGSSAGAPQAGSALDQCACVVGYVRRMVSIPRAVCCCLASFFCEPIVSRNPRRWQASVGYTFGWFAAVGFGRHFDAILRSPKPRLLIMCAHARHCSLSNVSLSNVSHLPSRALQLAHAL